MNDQFKGMLDRAMAVLATMFLGWLVKKGYIGESDSAQLLPALVLIPSLIYGFLNNTKARQLQKAAAVTGDNGDKTVVIAPKELANATPERNIISNETSTQGVHDIIQQAKT